MPNRPVFLRIGRFLLSVAVAIGGISQTGVAAPPARPDQESLFPTLQLNEDLIKSLKPSNHRDWLPEQTVLASADIHGQRVTVHHIRNCRWRSANDYTLAYYDKTFDLRRLRSVDFIMASFNETPTLGHMMLSFGFDGDQYLAISIEIRRERGEAFDAIRGVFQQYEIIYVVADERDVLSRRVNVDLCDVFLYRSTATPQQARALFLDVMHRVNKLARQPEFYDTLTNNCTTNLRRHINHLKPNTASYDYRALLPGDSDQLAYDLGLIEPRGSFEETRLRSRINYEAYLYRDDDDFSRKIRDHGQARRSRPSDF